MKVYLEEALAAATVPALLRTAADLWERGDVARTTVQGIVLYAAKRMGEET